MAAAPERRGGQSDALYRLLHYQSLFPAEPVTDLDGVIDPENKTITLTWSMPEREEGCPEITGFYVYQVAGGRYTKISEKLSPETGEYTVTDLDISSEYTFVLTSVATKDGKDLESVWSNEVNYRADSTPYIGSNGNWWVGDTDTGVKAAGQDGKDGKDGNTPYIGENGNWWIGLTDTKVRGRGHRRQGRREGRKRRYPLHRRQRQLVDRGRRHPDPGRQQHSGNRRKRQLVY